MGEKYFALPLPTDTEADTSFDLEQSFKEISKKPGNATAVRRSLFNLTPQSFKAPQVRKTDEFKSIEMRANKEIRQWKDQFTQIRAELKKAKQKLPVSNFSILSEANRNFLSNEPDMDRFLRTVHEFECKAHKFLENDFEDMMETRLKVAHLCQMKIQTAKQIKLNKLYCSDYII